MRKYILFFLLLPFVGHANWNDVFSDEEDPTLYHHVNVISGHLSLSFQDGMAQGGVPLPIFRSYTSVGALERTPDNLDLKLKKLQTEWMVQGGWNFFPHVLLLTEPDTNIKKTKVYLPEKTGGFICYSFEKKESKYTIWLKPEISYGQCSGTISARSNPQNNRLRFDIKKGIANLYLPDGSERCYKGGSFHKWTHEEINKLYFRLAYEILPSKHRIDYTWGRFFNRGLIRIDAKNPTGTKTFSTINFDSLWFDETGGLRPIHSKFIKTISSDHKEILYNFNSYEARDYLTNVVNPSKEQQVNHYEMQRKGIGARLTSLDIGSHKQVQVTYCLPHDNKEANQWLNDPKKKRFDGDRVLNLAVPTPTGFSTLADFNYSPGVTDVVDGDHLHTKYHYHDDKIDKIDYYNDRDELHSTIKFIWKEGRLAAKALLDAGEKAYYSKTFKYDSLGNVTEELFWGNLTGLAHSPFELQPDGSLKDGESYYKRYEYLPIFNVPTVEEEEGGATYRYSYLPGTNLQISKLIYEGGRIVKREFCLYDNDYLLIAEIQDNGTSAQWDDLTNVTGRFYKRYDLHPVNGMRTAVTEAFLDPNTQLEKMSRRIQYTYDDNLRVTAETVFDENNQLRMTASVEYDEYDHIKRKVDELGHESFYHHDPKGQLLSSEEEGIKKTFEYDIQGLLLKTTEVGPDGYEKITHNTYDSKGRLTSQIDSKGNETKQTYDCFGNAILTEFPKVKDENGAIYNPTASFTFDILGNIISSRTAAGHAIHTSYNALQKPIHIIYPDGAETRHFYNKNGTLAKSIYADGTTIEYEYDLFKQMTLKEIFSPEGQLLSHESWVYDAFQLLQKHEDPRGLVIHYSYDGAGRLLKEEAEGRKKEYSYDALGFLHRLHTGGMTHVQEYDVAGRIIQEWDEQDETGSIENQMRFFYNNQKLKEKAIRLTSQGEVTDLFTFDTEKRLRQHVDPEGAITRHIYHEDFVNDLGQKVLQKESIDPIGNISLQTFDANNHVIISEKQDPNHQTVSKEEFFYDCAGNKTKRISTVYLKDQPIRTICVQWQYDSMGRMIQETEGNHKVTKYQYDLRGRMIEKTLPNGVTLTYRYDDIDRPLSLSSSDQTINYRYLYDKGPDPIEIQDLESHTSLKRSYNHFGELLEETNPCGTHLSWHYDDPYGRCSKVTLPDGSSIAYDYTGSHLTGVKRITSDGQIRYEHRYTQFDVNGHLHQESLIKDLGIITTDHDRLERPSCQISPWFEQKIAFGLSGLVTQIDNTLFPTKTYRYDALNQLLQEGEITYLFDSVGNPAQYEVNSCNQILSGDGLALDYDKNGNPTKRDEKEQSISYKYDALGRLIQICTPGLHKIEYLYDPLSRLITKSKWIDDNGTWVLKGNLFYLNDQDNNIGILNSQAQILQVKVMGMGIKGEIGACIALELGDQLFAPLHDFQGNIIAIVSPSGSLFEKYETDAFGREKPSSQKPINPWRFCSKRCEEGFYFFGLRFYDPSLGRWLTPDPSGFSDGANLYAYVLNSPLNRLDLFGLNSMPKFLTHDTAIYMPVYHTNLKMGRGLIPCKGKIKGMDVDTYVSCGFLHKIKFTPEEKKAGYGNVFNHFSELINKDGNQIGLITLHNGINTSYRELYKMGNSIVNRIPEGTLFIALHNFSWGLIVDFDRVADELYNEETPAVIRTRQFLTASLEQMHKVNPNALMLNISHSEGGLQIKKAVEGMPPEHKALVQQHCVYFGVAPAGVFPDSWVKSSFNVYSDKDRVTFRYAKDSLNDPNYNISVVKCQTKWYDRTLFIADHNFLENTYQNAINDKINKERDKTGFYNENTR